MLSHKHSLKFPVNIKLLQTVLFESASWWSAAQTNKQPTHTTVGLPLVEHVNNVALMDKWTCLVCESSLSFAPCHCCGPLVIAQSSDLFQPKQEQTLAPFAYDFAVGSTMMMFFLLFKIVQNCSDLSHAFSGAGNGGKSAEPWFLIMLKEHKTGKFSPKGKETWENRNFLKENTTKMNWSC